MTGFTRALPARKLEQLPVSLAEMAHGISRRRLGLYPYVREVLDALREVTTCTVTFTGRGRLA
jgi:hypothetical protein